MPPKKNSAPSPSGEQTISGKGVRQIAENLYINLDAHTLCAFTDDWRESQRIPPKPYGILLFLSDRPNWAVDREELLAHVWNEQALEVEDRRVDSAVRKLRGHIQSFAPSVDPLTLISSISGTGYRINIDRKYRRYFSSLDAVFAPPDTDQDPDDYSEERIASLQSEAELLERNLQFELAFEIYEELASHGHARTINYLGVCYCKGEHVPRILSYGIEKYREAAELNYPPALLNMGDYHMNSELGEYDEAKAFAYYLRAATHPDSPDKDAMFRLHLCYQHGLGTKPNPIESERWRKKALALGVSSYQNFYQNTLLRAEAQPLISGDTLLRLSPPRAYCRLIHQSTGEETALRSLSVLVGSNPAACSVLLGSRADSRHALIRHPSDQTTIIDLHSEAGTFINGCLLPPLTECILYRDDVVSFGEESFLVADP